MWSERIRILPALIIVAIAAFSVRLADVTLGFSSMSGAAMAEEKQEQKQAKPVPDDETLSEVTDATPPELPEPEIVEGPDPIEINDAPEEGAEVDWRDASDQELDYTSVKMEMFDSLTERRKGLDQRERDMMTREALLKAAEQEIDRKFEELSQLRGEIETLLKQQSDEEEARISSLVKIYEGMKPKDAARIFDTLDLDVLVNVMGRMSERKLSPILAAMNAERARTITIMLAEQKQLPQLPTSN